MVKYKLEYSDGIIRIKDFVSEQAAQWFIHNEGDHLVRATKL